MRGGGGTLHNAVDRVGNWKDDIRRRNVVEEETKRKEKRTKGRRRTRFMSGPAAAAAAANVPSPKRRKKKDEIGQNLTLSFFDIFHFHCTKRILFIIERSICGSLESNPICKFATAALK